MTKWYDWLNEILSGAGIILGADIISTKELLGIILLVLNICIAIVSLALKLIQWYKNAKADGKITKDEIKEGVDIVASSIDDINKQIEDSKSSDKEER